MNETVMTVGGFGLTAERVRKLIDMWKENLKPWGHHLLLDKILLTRFRYFVSKKVGDNWERLPIHEVMEYNTIYRLQQDFSFEQIQKIQTEGEKMVRERAVNRALEYGTHAQKYDGFTELRKPVPNDRYIDLKGTVVSHAVNEESVFGGLRFCLPRGARVHAPHKAGWGQS